MCFEEYLREYQKLVLIHFLKKSIYHFLDYIFHQNSAPAHSSKMTIKYLKDNKIKFITPEKWTPQSLDNAPIDYFVGVY
jgi:hypothetical protein